MSYAVPWMPGAGQPYPLVPPQTYKCDSCPEEFKTNILLKYHKFRVHNSTRPYVCRRCYRSFRRINDLQQHSRRHRRRSEPYVCSVCDEVFKSRSSLRRHHGTHVHFEGDHECMYCSASFLYLAEARLHVLLIHEDKTVLPAERTRRHFTTSITDDREEVFSVKEGIGLKIKFKRKLSADYEPGSAATDDLNPGSHASDSGKGNSDMDEEDLLRNGNQLLKMPTFVVKHNESTITTTQPKLNLDSGLLTKPKLEVGNTQWGSSKTQPRLDSTDFLSKTNFGLSSSFGNKGGLGSMLAPSKANFGSPSHIGSFSPSPHGGLGSMKLESTKPLTSQPSLMTNTTNTLFNTQPPATTYTAFNNNTNNTFSQKPLGANWPSSTGNTLNGSVFKTPMFPANTAFGQHSAFGSQPKLPSFGMQPKPQPAFGQSTFLQPKPPTFGQSSFTSQKTSSSAFGTSVSFTPTGTYSTTTATFGGSAFGTSGSLGMKRSYPTTSSMSVPAHQRNGDLSQESVFGSRAKIKRMLATKESHQKKKQAFEQYAQPDTKLSANPFAAAMQNAKNPLPRRRTDSDVIEETTGSSSEYSDDYDSELSDVSGFTDDDAIEAEQKLELPTIQPDRVPSVPYAVAMTPAQPYASPTKPTSPVKPIMSPIKPFSPVKQPSPTQAQALSPQKMPVINDTESEEVSSIPSPTPDPEPVTESPSRSKKKARSKSKTPQHVPSVNNSPLANHEPVLSPISRKIKKGEEVLKEIESPMPAGRRTCRKNSKSMPTPDHGKQTPNHISTHQTSMEQKSNGDINTLPPKSSKEVSGHIDLEGPSMSLSIPQMLLGKSGGKRKPKATTKVRKPSSRSRKNSARTPSYQSFPTPSQVPATPAYPTAPRTPEHPSATPAYPAPPTPAYRPETPMYAPPTPAYPSQTPNHPSTIPPPNLPKPTAVKVGRPMPRPQSRAPTKAEMMEKMMLKQKELERERRTKAKSRKARIGPKSFMRKIGKEVESEPEPVDDSTLFYKSELVSEYSGRTDQSAPYRARFKQNQMYLCYLRRRALDLIITLFPDLRCGGNYCAESEDIDGLIEYVITSLEGQDSSLRCMQSLPDNGRETKNRIEVRVCRAGKNTVKSLQRKLLTLLKLVLPSLSLDIIEKDGIQTLPKLIHKVISENSS